MQGEREALVVIRAFPRPKRRGGGIEVGKAMAPPELFLVPGSSAASGEIGAAAAPPPTALATSWTSRPAWKRAVAVRVEVRRSYRTLHLADSTTIRRGDRIGVLHLSSGS